MKKLMIFLIVVWQYYIDAQQAVWQHVEEPTGGTVSFLSMSENNTIYAQTELCKIFASTNSGESWEFRGGVSGVDDYGFRCFAVTPSGNLYAGSWDGKNVYRSTDGGTSWSRTLGSTVIAVAAYTDSIIYVTGWTPPVSTSKVSTKQIATLSEGSLIYRTQDGGKNWQQIQLPAIIRPQSLAVNSLGKIFFGSQGSGVYTSEDGGNTLHPTNLTGMLIDKLYISQSGYVYAVNYSKLFCSKDEGLTWEKIGEWNVPIKAVAVDSTEIVFVSTGGFLYRSTSTSEEWEIIDLGSLDFISLLIAPTGDIYAGTNGNGIYKSMNLGDSWIEINTGFKAVYIQSIAKNYSGDLLVGTRNSGLFTRKVNRTNWMKTGLEGDTVNGILTLSINKIFAGTQHGVYQSEDNGLSWNQFSLKDTAVYSLAMDSLGNIFVGINGILRSLDGGKRWYVVRKFGVPILNFTVDSKGNIFAAGYGGVLRSINKGESWDQSFPALEKMAAITTLKDGSILVGAGGFGMLRTTDEGNTWDYPNIKASNISSLAVSSSGEIFAGDLHLGIFHSTDNGYTWTLMNEGLETTNITALAIDSRGYLVAGTGGHGLYIRDIVTSAEEDKSKIPMEFNLAQNYPNPFNPATTIQFALPEAGKFNLKVYNILGQEVVTLIDDAMSAGIYKVNFDARRMASGVYIYKLVGSNVNISKKMVLIK
jgi:photosystem II stability/assembly factor-like uncharacterized protein